MAWHIVANGTASLSSIALKQSRKGVKYTGKSEKEREDGGGGYHIVHIGDDDTVDQTQSKSLFWRMVFNESTHNMRF